MKTQIICLISSLLAGVVYAEAGRPADIPEAGRIRIDGYLADWKKMDWTQLDKNLDGSPVHTSAARWALRWNDDGMLYIAVQYDDTDIILQNGYVNSTGQDCVEIFVRGDTGSRPTDYSGTQSSAQHYIFGLSKGKTAVWKKMAAAESFPVHNPAKAAARLDGNTFTYEIMVPLYDRFSITSRRDCKMTEPYPEFEVGVDIAIADTGSTG